MSFDNIGALLWIGIIVFAAGRLASLGWRVRQRSNDVEAHTLLALIDAEFQSDPTSVQCFDRHIVERVRQCVEKRKRYLERNPWVSWWW